MGENWRDEHPVVGIFWHNFPEKWNPVYTHTLRMMKGLAGREGRLVFLTNKEDMSEPSDELVEGVHVKRSEYLIRRRSASSLNKPLLYLKWVLLFQLEEIRLAKMVYVRDLLFSTLLLCRLLGKPLVLEKNDVDEADPNLKRNLMGRLTYGLRLRVLDFVDAVVVQTEESKRAHERIGIPSKRIIVVPNGVDTDLFSFEERSASDKVKLLYIAHLDENKSLDITLSVAREMGDDVELSIVGDGPRRAEFEGAARRLGLDNVTFLGTVSHSEMPRIISAHDFGIGEYNLKYREFRKYGFFFFPLKILEYLSCGRPVFVNVSNGVIHELERSGTVLRVARK
ncbi:MAG: glycosyltransferase, partial [Thermoplasmata archaeon]|nr:glycosyltransferase [Thermoplasmata archaeon]